MEEIEQWSNEKKAFVIHNISNTAFGQAVAHRVIQRIANNDTDVCLCAVCYIKAYDEMGKEADIKIVEHWANEYELQAKDDL